MKCPKCGFEQDSKSECIRCGVIFAKYKPRPTPAVTTSNEPRKPSPETNPTPPKSGWRLKRGESEYSAPDIDSIRNWAKESKVLPDDYIYNPILAQWIYAKDLVEIQDLMRSYGTKCPHCGRFGVRKVDGLQGGENVIGLILVAFFFVPGVLYYFDRTRHPYCTACKRRVPNS